MVRVGRWAAGVVAQAQIPESVGVLLVSLWKKVLIFRCWTNGGTQEQKAQDAGQGKGAAGEGEGGRGGLLR